MGHVSASCYRRIGSQDRPIPSFLPPEPANTIRFHPRTPRNCPRPVVSKRRCWSASQLVPRANEFDCARRRVAPGGCISPPRSAQPRPRQESRTAILLGKDLVLRSWACFSRLFDDRACFAAYVRDHATRLKRAVLWTRTYETYRRGFRS